MGVAERRARQKASLRSRILDAARDMFARDGYEAVTMRRVAAAIEYSPTAIYLHFADKSALFNAICDETFSRLVARLARQHQRSPDPMSFLREGLLTYVTFGLEHPNHYTVTFILGARRDTPQEYEGSAGARAFGMLHDAVQAAVDAGHLRTDNVQATSQALWAAAHGVVSLLIRHPDFPFVSRRILATHAVDTMLAGLSARVARRSRKAP
jgi:AcrR family transcriptional regulator